MMVVGTVENRAIHMLNVMKGKMMKKEKKGNKITILRHAKIVNKSCFCDAT